MKKLVGDPSRHFWMDEAGVVDKVDMVYNVDKTKFASYLAGDQR